MLLLLIAQITKARFLSHDPLGYVDSLNLYEFALSNPVNFDDPLGLNGSLKYADFGDGGLGGGVGIGIGGAGAITFTQLWQRFWGIEKTPSFPYYYIPNERISDGFAWRGKKKAKDKTTSKPKGKKCKDSSKAEKHGDSGRAEEKIKEQIEKLQKQLKKATLKRDKIKIKKTIDRITKDAARKKKGETHWK